MKEDIKVQIRKHFADGTDLKGALKAQDKISNPMLDAILAESGPERQKIKGALPCYTSTFYVYNPKDVPFGDTVIVPYDTTVLIVHIPDKCVGLANTMLAGITESHYAVSMEDDPNGLKLRALVKERKLICPGVQGLINIGRDVITHVEFLPGTAIVEDWGMQHGYYYVPEPYTGIGHGDAIDRKSAHAQGVAAYRRHLTGQNGYGPSRPFAGLVVRGMHSLRTFSEERNIEDRERRDDAQRRIELETAQRALEKAKKYGDKEEIPLWRQKVADLSRAETVLRSRGTLSPTYDIVLCDPAMALGIIVAGEEETTLKAARFLADDIRKSWNRTGTTG